MLIISPNLLFQRKKTHTETWPCLLMLYVTIIDAWVLSMVPSSTTGYHSPECCYSWSCGGVLQMGEGTVAHGRDHSSDNLPQQCETRVNIAGLLQCWLQLEFLVAVLARFFLLPCLREVHTLLVCCCYSLSSAVFLLLSCCVQSTGNSRLRPQ